MPFRFRIFREGSRIEPLWILRPRFLHLQHLNQSLERTWKMRVAAFPPLDCGGFPSSSHSFLIGNRTSKYPLVSKVVVSNDARRWSLRHSRNDYIVVLSPVTLPITVCHAFLIAPSCIFVIISGGKSTSNSKL